MIQVRGIACEILAKITRSTISIGSLTVSVKKNHPDFMYNHETKLTFKVPETEIQTMARYAFAAFR